MPTATAIAEAISVAWIDTRMLCRFSEVIVSARWFLAGIAEIPGILATAR
ncbi:hypothetical protein [Gordonia sp. FQ]